MHSQCRQCRVDALLPSLRLGGCQARICRMAGRVLAVVHVWGRGRGVDIHVVSLFMRYK
jgi:hypothetical protein